jgi:hypothetical protein
MDQLIDQLVDKVGLTRDQAQQSVEAVEAFLKDKLPADVMGQIDGAIGAVGDMAGDAAGAAAGAAGAATDAAGDAADAAKDTGSGVMDSIKGALGR